MPKYRNPFSRVASALMPMLIAASTWSCSSAPTRAQDTISVSQAREWLAQYCSKGPRELSGSLVFLANTPEFKGQHPGSVRMEKSGAFVLEATHILGGTLLRITSDGKTLDLVAPSRPKTNRSGITRYLGIELPILQGLLAGDLPCPTEWKTSEIAVEGSEIRLATPSWIWSFSRAVEQDDRIPFGIDLIPSKENPGRDEVKPRIELRIESWDRKKGFARKVKIHTPEGDLKWTWRSRE